MIHSIYTSVSNANIVPCEDKKGLTLKSEPIPLLRDNYLSEYRTELEKAKVRKNLGIADDLNLLWENIGGFIDNNEALVLYVGSMHKYLSKFPEEEYLLLTTLKLALDFALEFIHKFLANDARIDALAELITEIQGDLNTTLGGMRSELDDYASTIGDLIAFKDDINTKLLLINSVLSALDIDQSISTWINAKLESSKTLQLSESSLEVKISSKENNIITLDDINGLYAKGTANYDPEISDTTKAPVTIGGIAAGTTVQSLRNKSIEDILSLLLFPTIKPVLVKPTLSYTGLPKYVKVGNPIIDNLTYKFNPGNSGGQDGEPIKVVEDKDGNQVTSYDTIGNYTHKITINYLEGEESVDNTGLPTGEWIKAGSITATAITTATYPWYTGIENQTQIEMDLVPFGVTTEIEFLLSGKALILIPGANSVISEFKVDGGLGYMNVNEQAWTISSTTLNNITYKVWTINDSYPEGELLNHKFKLTLKL